MKFVSRNEIGQFDFTDCRITSVTQNGADMEFELESLIVLENNSQNSNYTKSYADTSKMTLKESIIESIMIAGYKTYDAYDNLVSEVADKVIEEKQYGEVLTHIKGSYLYRMVKVSEDEKLTYDLEIEELGEDGLLDLRNDTYVIRVTFTECIIEWDKYLNRVQS